MFKGRIVSRSNINGKVHTFQKDFDDYDSYSEFVEQNPEYSPRNLFQNVWNPWSSLDGLVFPYNKQNISNLPAETRYLPEGINLDKYEKRRTEKLQTEAEKLMKKQSLERSKAYLADYLEENPEDNEAKMDLEKIEKELKSAV